MTIHRIQIQGHFQFVMNFSVVLCLFFNIAAIFYTGFASSSIWEQNLNPVKINEFLESFWFLFWKSYRADCYILLGE